MRLPAETYRWIRNTHLWLGLLAAAFLLMYGVSAVQMSHNAWFSLKPTVTEQRLSLAPGTSDPRAVARELMDNHGARGELLQARSTAAGSALRIQRPGTVYEVEYTAATGEARMRTQTVGFMGMLNRIHHVAGLWHEYRLLNVWGFLVGLVSVALLLSGLTGIYLWFRMYDERVAGGILLGASLAYSLTLILLLRLA
jgi:hypothetical protein